MTKVTFKYLSAKTRLSVIVELGPLKHFEEAERLRLIEVVEKYEARRT